MYSFFIGVDVSKDFLDVSYVLFGKSCYLGNFSNSNEGYLRIINSLNIIHKSNIDNWLFCFENTGVYSKGLAAWLYDYGIAFKEENPLQINRSLGLKRGKNDKADSKAIAMYAFEKRTSIVASKPCKPLILKLKKLVLRRAFLIKQRTALKNSIQMHKLALDDSLLDLFASQTKDLIEILNNQINDLEDRMEQIKSEDKYVKKNDELIRTVVGVGQIVSNFILAYTENFERIGEPRKLASFIGIAPFENSSGTYEGKTRVSNLANKKLKSILSNAAFSAIKHDPQIANYYVRKLKEGKEKGIVINAVKNKLVQRIYAVVKRQQPYVKLDYV